jgi:fatty-acyl-CoA synthase
MASFGATLTAGTSTAVHLAVRAQRDRPLPGRLALRTCVIGAERVEYDTLERAVATFGPYGLGMRDFVPAYGLAEATLAVTASPVGTEPKAVTLDARRLADGETVDVDAEDPLATWLVSAGPPCPGVRVEVGEPAGPRGPGEPGGPGGAAGTGRVAGIRVSSPCLAEGYFGDSARTRATFDNGWLTTGDLGFLRDGELYVAGRDDDLISMAGRTVSTREIEWSVAALDPVRKGCVVVLDVPMRRRHRVVLMAETKGGVDDFRALAGHAARIAARKAGVTISECVFLRPGTLPKTPSGKVQRFRCRKLLLDECFEPFQHVVLNEEA